MSMADDRAAGDDDAATPSPAMVQQPGQSAPRSGGTQLLPGPHGTPSTQAEAGGDTVRDRPRWRGWLTNLRRRNRPNLRNDLADALSERQVQEVGSLSPEERAMLGNVLRLQDLRIEDVMVPRADIQAVEIGITLGELLRLFEDAGHSRMPVYAETLDDPRGMVHIRDVMVHVTRTAALTKPQLAQRRKPVASGLDLKKVNLDRTVSSLRLVREVLFVPPSMRARDLMARMQATRIQMALVIDEYGGTEGLVSLEDLVEQIVGDISDEHDSDDDGPLVRRREDGIYVVDAKAELEDLAEILGEDMSGDSITEDVDTLGGLMLALAGRVPVRGEILEGLGLEFRVLDADPRRVKRVAISIPAQRQRPAPLALPPAQSSAENPAAGEPEPPASEPEAPAGEQGPDEQRPH